MIMRMAGILQVKSIVNAFMPITTLLLSLIKTVKTERYGIAKKNISYF